ncbi:MAG: hypothetical protein ACQKBU_02545, partial [Verrucomicrobiales bacterium]
RCPLPSTGDRHTRHLIRTGRAAAVDCSVAGWGSLLRERCGSWVTFRHPSLPIRFTSDGHL